MIAVIVELDPHKSDGNDKTGIASITTSGNFLVLPAANPMK